ncbi:hypothetical protein [Curtobacterium sp. MCSS17_015]|uniref:hypothetical protein n=1 Tax=Curtobacterium sp. MCSS17_015 TaxID=2175666 RepID=UPI0015E898FC|nr:hypothetical protein [Curtobacterium sp. MCSS17_015]WIB26728.1 hypothetical protein DEJ18_01150 [Curtobacterium sp. MCSS17_015]
MIGILSATSAAATVWHPAPETGTPGGLTLDTDRSHLDIPDLAPGQPAFWQIHTRVDRDGTVRLDLDVRKDGDLVAHPRGLQIAVTACDEEWQEMRSAPWCAAPHPIVRPSPTSPAGRTALTVPHPRADGETFLLVEFSLPDTAAAASDESLMGLTATVGIGVTATTDTGSLPGSLTPDNNGAERPAVSSTRPAPSVLAWTGTGVVVPCLIGVALIITGFTLRQRRFRGAS